MAKLVKIYKGLRNHPKKSIVFSCIAAYGINYGKDKYKEEQLLAQYCREAAMYGEQRHRLSQDLRHVTVLLNPAAAGGKCKSKFDKYCAPLLHLAGLKVALVRTEHQGQARDLMAIMEKTDAVVVAGGDGTLSEVLTGLLRREDQAALRLPLGILPLGNDSSSGRAMWGIRDTPGAQELLEATMAVVKQVLRPMDVVEITPHPTEDTESNSKPIYASMLEWGAYKEAWERRDVYWYWASLRRYVTYVFSSYKDLSWDCESDIQYTLPCSGCSSCRSAVKQEASVVAAPAKSWYQYLIPSMRPSNFFSKHEGLLPPEPKVDYSSIDNPSCGEVHHTTVAGVCDVRIGNRNNNSTSYLKPHQLLFSAGTDNTTAKQFIKEGWQRIRTSERTNDTEITVGSITLTPKGQQLKNKQGEDREYYIDGETYEVRPVTIRPVPKAVTIFSSPAIPA